MDIQKIINDVVDKLQSNKTLKQDFMNNPTKVLESLVGIDLPDDKIDPIIDGIKAKLNLDDLADTAEDVLGLLGGLFGKK